MSKVLLVVDVQNDFISGVLGTPEAQAIVPNIKKRIEQYLLYSNYSDRAKVIYTMDTHLPEDFLFSRSVECNRIPTHCLADTNGWDIQSDCYYPAGNIVPKSQFGYVDWDAYIDHADEVEIIGLCTDICVISNALILRAMFPSMLITVNSSCCAGTTPDKHRAALEVMKSCLIDVME